MHHSRQHRVKALGVFLCVLLASCEGSSLGNSLEKNLEPDPQLLAEETVDNKTVNSPASETPAPPPKKSESARATDTPRDPAPTKTDDPVTPPTFTPASYADIKDAPKELQQYIEDLVALDVLTLVDVSADVRADPKQTPNEFLPNDIITRREYARWLLAVNNHFYDDQRPKKIRPAVDTAQPAFQDVGKANVDFAAIQGLAEAGIIPSPLNGSTTALKFRPDAPLTRKDLILWKVPLDTRAALPAATAVAVTEAWGFQDAGKIEPSALGAVLADHGNGEFANIRRTLGYTTLFQPDKGVTRAEAAAVLWRFGNLTEGITAHDVLSVKQDKDLDHSQNKTTEAAQ